MPLPHGGCNTGQNHPDYEGERPMGERSDQITRQIEETRSDLGYNLQELETKVKDATDWRKQFQKSPFTMIGIAFGGGILVAQVFGGGSRRSRRYCSREF